jgi:predicted ferric reductase
MSFVYTILHGLRRGLESRSQRNQTTDMPAISQDAGQTGSDSVLPYTYGLTGVDVSRDHILTNILWGSMITLAIIMLLVRLVQMGNSHLRHLFTLSSTPQQQIYWSHDYTSFWPSLKKYLLYAPLGKKRHNREIKLSEATNVGTLPSRFHTVLLSLYLLSNLVYCLLLDWTKQERAALIAEVRGRTGVLAVVNMLPLILLAGRNNPLIPLLKVSFDTYNLLHRWMGRIVIIEAIAHTIAWYVNTDAAKGPGGSNQSIAHSQFLQYGLVGTLSMAIILVQSPSVVRHAFYETFLHLHQFLAFLSILGVYVHIDMGNLQQKSIIRAIVVIWVSERCARFFHMIYLNFSRNKGVTKVEVEALEGEACRVTFSLPRRVNVKPGTHVYAYLPSVSWWMSHPFSVAWTAPFQPTLDPSSPTPKTSSRPPPSPASLEKQGSLPQIDRRTPTSVSLVMLARTGMTRTLYNRASAAPSKTIHMTGFIEGPYAGHDKLNSYGTVLLFAGGVGITHQLMALRSLLDGYDAGTVAARKIVLVWSVRSVEQLTWVRSWMDEVLAMPGRRQVLKIMLFVTKPKSPREVVSPSNTVLMFPGRCSPGVLVKDEVQGRVGAMGVTVCGPGAFADEVRQAVRTEGLSGRGGASVDFIEEAFTW